MSKTVVIRDREPAPLALADAAREFVDAARSSSTRRVYAAQWALFEAWCLEHASTALPAAPGTVALYLADRARNGARPATLDVALAAISAAHRRARLPNPRASVEVTEVRAGIRRKKGTMPVQKAAFTVEHVKAAVALREPGLAGLRDRALLLLGFGGAFRRSELVGLETGDLQFGAEGVAVLLRRSKTDQTGEGRVVAISNGQTPETDPVRVLQEWLAAAEVSEGPVFRAVDRFGRVGSEALSGRDVSRIVKRLAAAIGLDPSRFGGHSLRAGFVTSAVQAKASTRAIQIVTGHSSERMVLRYAREANLFAHGLTATIGL